MNICVIGTGYVGLVAGTCLAETGHDVICVDSNSHKVEMLRRGESPIYEPGLEELLHRNIAEGRLTFTEDLTDAVQAAEIVYIAVSTPEGEDGQADLTALMAVTDGLGAAMNGYKVVVIKSTVPVGTNTRVTERLSGLTAHPFDVVSNPEFLKEGSALDDFMRPDRLIVGTNSPKARQILQYVYEPLTRTENPIIYMDPPSAEMTKYASNAFLATRVSFMNEVANLCEAMGADVDAVRRGMGADRRIGYRFLFPGIGFGGSCFPKDVQALMHMGATYGVPMRIINSVDSVNDDQKRLVKAKVERTFGTDLRGMRFAIWGLAFKPGTDDMREAPSLTIIEDLLAAGAEVVAYDPVAVETAREELGDRIRYAQTNYDAVAGADVLVLVTEWNEFRRPDFGRVRKAMRGKVIIDGRNVLDPDEVCAQGFDYHSVGRQPRSASPDDR